MGTESVFPKDLTSPTKALHGLSLIYLKSLKSDLEKNSPEYLKLLESTLNTVILAEPGVVSKSPGMNFGGATYFFFWGGTIVNSQTLRSYYTFYEQLIHESCHMALFMLCSKYGILCTNPDTELYQSAFRKDSGRPMHGVFHAYFVAKNLAECFKHVPSIAKQNKISSELLYKEIRTHANLTSFGEFILEKPEIVYCDSLVESNIEF